MQNFVRAVRLPADYCPVPPAVRDERHKRRRDRVKVPDNTGPCVGPDYRVPVALQVHRADNPMDEPGPRGVTVRVNVDLPGQFVADTHISRVGVLHEIDSHTAHQPGDCIHARRDFRVMRQTDIAPTGQTIVLRRIAQPRGGTPSLRRLSPRFLSAFTQSSSPLRSPHQALAFCRLSMFSRYRMQANTEASNRSIRCSGCTFSY